MAQPVNKHRIVISQRLRDAAFNDDFTLTTAEGSKVRLYADGRTESTPSGDVAKQLSSQALNVERQVTKEDGGTLRVDYIIVNSGLEERGIPGVRIATVEGNIIETDAYGRYHLEGIDVANIARGRNFIMKVDPATLPPRSEFTTANPLVKRITQGVPARFDFGVRLPTAAPAQAGAAVQGTGGKEGQQ